MLAYFILKLPPCVRGRARAVLNVFIRLLPPIHLRNIWYRKKAFVSLQDEYASSIVELLGRHGAQVDCSRHRRSICEN